VSSTEIPQYLLEAGWASAGQQVAITQPRRISAISVASRVATEVGTVLGDEVGYSIRFEEVSNPLRTRIKFLTDGMLFRECMRDPLLTKYSAIMIDEAHERGAYTDLLLGLIKKIRRKRPELRIIVSSATIDARSMLDFFTEGEGQAEATILSLEGRTHPVEVSHLAKPCSDYVKVAVDTVWSIHLNESQGDILVFLTGREEIDRCLQTIADRLLDLPTGSLPLQLLPLHAGLTSEEQVAVFTPTARGSRKCIVATNIAETSVTIEGVKYVIDCGFVKVSWRRDSTTRRLSMLILLSVPRLGSSLQPYLKHGYTRYGSHFTSVRNAKGRASRPHLTRQMLSLVYFVGPQIAASYDIAGAGTDRHHSLYIAAQGARHRQSCQL
jgi:ATP-dependent RNA helicase DDX35